MYDSSAWAAAQRESEDRNQRVYQEMANRGSYNSWVAQQNQNRDQAAQDRVNNARTQAYGLSEGRMNDVRNDPVDQMIREQLANRTSTDVPYNQGTIDTMIAQGNEASSAAFQNQQRHLDRSAGQGGVAVTDPAYQAAMRENKENQTQRNITTRRDVNAQAQVANHGARGQALGQLGSHNNAYQNRMTDTTGNVVRLHTQEMGDIKDRPTMNYSQWSQQNSQPQNPFRLPSGYLSGKTGPSTTGYSSGNYRGR